MTGLVTGVTAGLAIRERPDATIRVGSGGEVVLASAISSTGGRGFVPDPRLVVAVTGGDKLRRPMIGLVAWLVAGLGVVLLRGLAFWLAIRLTGALDAA